MRVAGSGAGRTHTEPITHIYHTEQVVLSLQFAVAACCRLAAQAFDSYPLAVTSHWLKTILSDIQFWVPVVVLIGGLFVLRWIQ
jgi:hypothetical protein